MSTVAFSPPIAGKLFSKDDPDNPIPVTIIALDLGMRQVVIVDEDAIAHVEGMEMVDFTSVAPRGDE